MPVRTDLIESAFLFATNTSELYPDFVRNALHETPQVDRLTINTGSGKARMWCAVAERVWIRYHRETHDPREPTTAERLALAAALSDHYATHIAEFTPDVLTATIHKHFGPGAA